MTTDTNHKCGITPENITSLRPNEVFVFGSNLAGSHGGGAARFAFKNFGAQWGVGVGMQGQSYAIPTMHGEPDKIKPYVDQFIDYAKANPDKHFLVTKIGCGIAGFLPSAIAPLFKDTVDLSNVSLPIEFIKYNAPRYQGVIGWDQAEFLKHYNQLIGIPSQYARVKELRAKEFRNTVDLVKQGYYINSRGERVSLVYPTDSDAEFYSSEIFNDPRCRNRFERMEVEVLNDDCIAIGIRLKEEGYNPAILNMASRRNPGGGVFNGAGAQEETLFRRSNLFRSLYQFGPYAEMYGIKPSPFQYPLDRNYGGVYTPDALIFREDESSGFRLMDDPVHMAFIAVAGINGPKLESPDTIAPELVPPTKNKIRTILRIGVKHGHDALVLGALGCGAFRNPPKHIARLFREVLEEEEFKNAFRKIVFAILEDHNAHKAHNPEGNFKPFAEEFRGW